LPERSPSFVSSLEVVDHHITEPLQQESPPPPPPPPPTPPPPNPPPLPRFFVGVAPLDHSSTSCLRVPCLVLPVGSPIFCLFHSPSFDGHCGSPAFVGAPVSRPDLLNVPFFRFSFFDNLEDIPRFGIPLAFNGDAIPYYTRLSVFSLPPALILPKLCYGERVYWVFFLQQLSSFSLRS